MIYNFAELLPKKRVSSPELEKKFENILLDHISKMKYEITPENRQSVEIAVKTFSVLQTYLKSEHRWRIWKKSKDWSYEKEPELYSRPVKGLFVYGSTGTGKTMLLRILSAVSAETFPVEFLTFPELVRQYMADGDKFLIDFCEKNKNEDLVIDEIGGESSSRRYGNDDVAHQILTMRYEHYINYGALTFFSTNLSSEEEIKKAYGERVFSRFIEMSNFIILTGKDRRK